MGKGGSTEVRDDVAAGTAEPGATGRRRLRDVSTGGDPDHPYSLVRTADGRTGWLSGVLPYAPDGSLVRERDDALAAAMRVLGERLDAAGATYDDVVKVTVYLTDLSWRDALNDVFRRTFAEPLPARTAVEVRALPKGAPVELDAVCVVAPAVVGVRS